MTLGRSAATVGLALALALAITAVLATAGPSAPTQSPVDISDAGERRPAPTAAGAPNGSPPPDVADFPQFRPRTEEVGFVYQPAIPASIEDVNAGVYVADVDGNGYEDVLAVGEAEPTLFRNVGGQFVEQRSFDVPRVQAAHFFDYDVDGDRDLLLAQYAGRLVFFENEDGEFVRRDVGFDRRVSNPTSIVAADVTGNGCLDVFVTQTGLWASTTPLTLEEAREVRAEHPAVRPTTESGTPNLLYHGTCSAFTDATGRAGIEGERWSLASAAVDLTGDGHVDIHVGNDWTADRLYVNRGNGTFEQRRMGPASDRNAMSSVARDVDGDFDLDLFVTNIYYPPDATRSERAPPLNRDSAVPEGNNLFVNDGTGTFTDRAPDHGLQKGGWGWTATLGDLNNDGHTDIAQTTENVYWVEPYAAEYGSLQLWTGTPQSWRDVDSREHGLDQSNTYAIARTDFDNDGDLDLLVGTAPLGPTLRGEAQPFRLYENTLRSGGGGGDPGGTGADALQLFVRDPDALDRNAAVTVETDRRTRLFRVNGRGDFQSQDSRMLHVGTGGESVERVTVVWPDGTTRAFTDLVAGHRYVLTQDGARRVP